MSFIKILVWNLMGFVAAIITFTAYAWLGLFISSKFENMFAVFIGYVFLTAVVLMSLHEWAEKEERP